MKQILLIIGLLLVCLFSYGQVVKRDSAGNFYEVRRTFTSAADFAAFKGLTRTDLTYTDKTGDIWPVWQKGAKYYWIKPSAAGQYSAREIKAGK